MKNQISPDVELLCVGTEILLGNIVNTNSQTISEELHNIGVNVFYHNVVGDNFDRVLNALEVSFSRSNTIITTGGLGPTKDDMTKEAISIYFDEPLVLFENEKEKLINYFNTRNRVMSENNLRQAYFPKCATIIKNNNGTAPGMILEKDGKTIIMLPGPPHEMLPMLKESVIPYLSARTNKLFVSKTMNFIGIGESALEDKISHLIDRQTNPTIAPYAKLGYPILRVTASGDSVEKCTELVENCCSEIKSLVGEQIFGYNEVTPEEVIVKSLIEKNMTIAFAESCTGGMTVSTLLNINNSSKVLNESFITYSNESKVNRLNVPVSILENHGAVSEECAYHMAIGVRQTSKSDIGISITGIAGDGGGSDTKPVGLVYIGLSTKDSTIVRQFNFSRKRNDNRRWATIGAFEMIIDFLKEIN